MSSWKQVGAHRLPRPLELLLLVALLVAAVSFARDVVGTLRGSDFEDFQILFKAARTVADGRTPYDAVAARDPAWRGPYIYPPFVAAILAPISHIDGLRAAQWYAAASVVLYLASFILLVRTEAIPWRSPPLYLLAIAFLLFEPTKLTLLGAQHEFMFLWLFVLSQRALVHTPVRQGLLGVWIAFGAIVKLYRALLLMYLLLQRWWTAIAAFFLAFGALTLFSIVAAGWPVQRQFWWEIVPVLLHGGSVNVENQASTPSRHRFRSRPCSVRPRAPSASPSRSSYCGAAETRTGCWRSSCR